MPAHPLSPCVALFDVVFFLFFSCRKARRNYEIMEKFEAGIELVGSEVKSRRMSKVNMDEGFAQVGGRPWYLVALFFAPLPLRIVEAQLPRDTKKRADFQQTRR